MPLEELLMLTVNIPELGLGDMAMRLSVVFSGDERTEARLV
jgi:hypothetical protein